MEEITDESRKETSGSYCQGKQDPQGRIVLVIAKKKTFYFGSRGQRLITNYRFVIMGRWSQHRMEDHVIR